jgi:hypothetical protein
MKPIPERPGGGAGIVLILILALLAAGLAYWGWSAHKPGAPAPAATGVPPTAPSGAGRPS